MPYKNEDPRLRGSSKGYTVRKHTQRLHCLASHGGSAGPGHRRALSLGECSAVTILKVLVMLEPGPLHLHFVVGATNYGVV